MPQSSPSAEELLPPRAASPFLVHRIHGGRSLSDAHGSNTWPGRLTLATALMAEDRAYVTIQRSITPGSSLFWRWSHSSDHPDARLDITDFKLLVSTEAVPLSTTRRSSSPKHLIYSGPVREGLSDRGGDDSRRCLKPNLETPCGPRLSIGLEH
jgi:hypothetical protein